MIKDIVSKIYETEYCLQCRQHKIICLMSRRQDPLSEATLVKLDELLADPGFGDQVFAQFKKEVTLNIQGLFFQIETSLRQGRDPRIECSNLKAEIAKLDIVGFEELLELYGRDSNVGAEGLSCFVRCHFGEGVESYFSKYYALYKILLMFYAEYERSRQLVSNILTDHSERLEELYSGVGVSLRQEDKQFGKYGLLTFDKNMWFDYDHLARGVVDGRLDKFFSVPVTENLAGAIHQLHMEGKIGALAFRVMSITDGRPSMEEKAYGSVLSFELSGLPAISEFYSAGSFGDKLVVIHDSQAKSLIFEELNDEFELVGDSVVTQLVHLEYECVEGGCVMTHIDHEHILYTLDQYDQRVSKSDTSVRGNKIKSFKIDKASIPVDFQFNGEYFLAIVLDAFFINKKLIAEYFGGARPPLEGRLS
ncbi:hypothetical protein [Pseudomonas tussilaginis]|uniref:hypothetical protein n=1 Tax=Pseudomonas sp. 5 TaxID=1619949 RepID=UPI0005EB939F|nr:hypothetical protein [Pseudomonas sp. 5]KJK07859.1 hypothetical protein UB47_10580 [Pseudomonas sp. 5]